MPARPLLTLPDDFHALVRVGAPDACWPWLGEVSPWGYGVGPNCVPGHLWSWRLHYGDKPLKAGYRLYQTCNNRLCCNPRHMRTRKVW